MCKVILSVRTGLNDQDFDRGVCFRETTGDETRRCATYRKGSTESVRSFSDEHGPTSGKDYIELRLRRGHLVGQRRMRDRGAKLAETGLGGLGVVSSVDLGNEDELYKSWLYIQLLRSTSQAGGITISAVSNQTEFSVRI